MEDKSRWSVVTAIAPVAWGATYFVTRHFLPADTPLWGGVLRALPAGLVLLAIRRKRPHGSLWWKSLILGTLNMSAFFALIYVAAQRLPTGIASTVMATSSLTIMLFAWLLLSEGPRLNALTGATMGLAGVCLMVLSGAQAIDPLGLLASVAAMTISSVGYILAKKWTGQVDVLAATAWQLIGGGLTLLPFAFFVEGNPPALSARALLGFGYVSIVATALAFAAWFAGLRHLRAGTVGLIGLLNPVTGVLLGHFLAGEGFGTRQGIGLGLVLIGVVVGRRQSSAGVSEGARTGRARALSFPGRSLARPCRNIAGSPLRRSAPTPVSEMADRRVERQGTPTGAAPNSMTPGGLAEPDRTRREVGMPKIAGPPSTLSWQVKRLRSVVFRARTSTVRGDGLSA